MIEITNKTKSPVQIIVRSHSAPKSFTTLNIPGIGSGKNICNLKDELWTAYIDKVENMGLITQKRINLEGE